MLRVVLAFQDEANRALEAGVYLEDILKLEVRDRIARSKYVPEEEIHKIDNTLVELKEAVDKLISEGGVLDA